MREKSENEKYRDEHYPHLKPCNRCYYWKGTNMKGAAQSYPMCYYMLINGEPRGCEPNYLEETCEKFVPKGTKMKRKKPVYIKD